MAVRLLSSATFLFVLLGTPGLSFGEPVNLTVDVTQKTFDIQCMDEEGACTEDEVKWTFKDIPVVAATKPKDKEYEIFPNCTLRLLKIEPSFIGVYSCADGSGATKQFNLRVKPRVEKFEKPRNVIQDDPMRLECKAWGVPAPTVTWLHNDVPIVVDGSNANVKLLNTSTLENTTLYYAKMAEDAGGEYTCVATSIIDDETYSANATIVVTVKDKYAALWPFLGICAEVAVLCTIILIYERRRAKRIEEEERAEEAAHLNAEEKKATPASDDVRQRK